MLAVLALAEILRNARVGANTLTSMHTALGTSANAVDCLRRLLRLLEVTTTLHIVSDDLRIALCQLGHHAHSTAGGSCCGLLIWQAYQNDARTASTAAGALAALIALLPPEAARKQPLDLYSKPALTAVAEMLSDSFASQGPLFEGAKETYTPSGVLDGPLALLRSLIALAGSNPPARLLVQAGKPTAPLFQQAMFIEHGCQFATRQRQPGWWAQIGKHCCRRV